MPEKFPHWWWFGSKRARARSLYCCTAPHQQWAPPPSLHSGITAVRLANGSTDSEGRLEVQAGGFWGAVTAFGGVGDNAAKVGSGLVCDARC